MLTESASKTVTPEMVERALAVYLDLIVLSPEKNPMQSIIRRMLEAAIANQP